MMPRTILLFRHCQTELSRGKRLIGQSDVRLSPEGIAYAEEIGKRLLEYESFHHIFCSSLKRSKETAEIISSFLNIRVESLDDLNEINLGIWDGRYIEEIKKEDPKGYDDRGKDIINYRVPGGENFVDLYIRVKKVFNDLIQSHQNMIIVGHKSVNRIILSDMIGVSLKDIMTIPQDHGCCNRIEQQGMQLKIKYINRHFPNL